MGISKTGGPLFEIRVLLLAAAVPLLMRAVKLPRLGDWLEPEGAGAAPADPATAEALARRIDRLLRLAWPVVRRGCLVRGVTLYRFLREGGHDVALCFGVGRPDGEEGFSGHCWIEQGGRALAEKREPRSIYTETFRISPQTARPETA